MIGKYMLEEPYHVVERKVYVYDRFAVMFRGHAVTAFDTHGAATLLARRLNQAFTYGFEYAQGHTCEIASTVIVDAESR